MKIHSAEITDIKIIQDIAYKTWPRTFGEILSPEQITYMLEMMYSEEVIKQQIKEEHKYMIYFEGEEYLGYISYQKNYKQGVTKIHKLYVLPESHGKGVGRKLIDYVESEVKNSSEFLTLNVNRYNKAVSFYERIGFIKDKEENIDIGNGFLMEDYVMIKKLN